MNSKYSNFLTVLLVLIIIAIVGIIGFLGFKYYKTQVEKNEGEDFVDSFNNQNTNIDDNTSALPPTNEDISFEGVDEGTNNSGNSNGGGNSSINKPKFNGFYTDGTIEIPATNLKCPILAYSEYPKKGADDTAPIILYGPGLNKVGITTISSHNKRNGTLFSNNKKLKIGDKIFITDLTGKRLTYVIYDKFEAESNYGDYLSKDTQGEIEIALSTCTDDSQRRIIILARAEV